MSDRERWIIYPLLFLTLLLVARDKIAPPDPLTCGTLVCNRLLVETPSGRRLVHIGGHIDSGAVVVYGPEFSTGDGEPLEPRVILDDRNPGRPTLEMGADEAGGYVTLFGPMGAPVLKVGHHASVRASGLLALEGDGTPLSESPQAGGSSQGWAIPWAPQDAESRSTGQQPAEAELDGPRDAGQGG